MPAAARSDAGLKALSQNDSPYEAPKSQVEDPKGTDVARLQRIASGQNFATYAILLNLRAYGVSAAASDIVAGLVFIAALVLSIIDIFTLGETATPLIALRVLQAILMIVPLISLQVLFSLNSRATRLLRKDGYRVGLLGPRANNVPVPQKCNRSAPAAGLESSGPLFRSLT